MIQRNEQTMDGNQAAAHVAYAYSEAAAIYPITPSSPMAELCDEWAKAGRKNIFDKTLNLAEMQSEAGAAGAVHGALSAGALATTFTSSQGLLLMLPNIYRIAGELLPGVIHVASRAIATHALSIFGDHSDIYACRPTGAAIFSESNVQEVMDLSPVSHICSLLGSLPFINFFDGFRTSHELQKVSVWEYSQLASLFPSAAYEKFRLRALSPSHGKIYGSAQNPDIFFQNREAANPFYNALPDIVEEALEKINNMLGTSYGLVNYYGAPDAEHVIVAMGSVCNTIREFMMYSGDQNNKPGLICIHLYRPFPVSRFLTALPNTVRRISVLTRAKEPGAAGEPLYLDVLSAINNSRFQNVEVFSGIYGLGSKDTTPAQIAAVYANSEKRRFTLGIEDDVTHLSLPLPENKDNLISTKSVNCMFWGLGGDGTISASKNIIKIIGNNSPLKVQGYFEYDSKKSGGLTISHLRYGQDDIFSAYSIEQADILVCTNPVYIHKYDLMSHIKDGGIFLLNLYGDNKKSDSAIEEMIPDHIKYALVSRNIRLFIIEAQKIGRETGLNQKVSTIIQAAFFAVSKVLPLESAEKYMIAFAEKTYKKAGEKVLAMNRKAIKRGLSEVYEYVFPEEWKSFSFEECGKLVDPDFEKCDYSRISDDRLREYVCKIMQPVLKRQGDKLPVSVFLPYASGVCVPGTSACEKRNIADFIPKWKPENCIQCNRCSFACPHAVIRPAILSDEELKNAPEGMETIPVPGCPGYNFSIVISAFDCTGCGSCVGICPGKGDGNKALDMFSVNEYSGRQDCFDYAVNIPEKNEIKEKYKNILVKSSQFEKPMMQFSGACAGCGETPYVKLLTQLFGKRLYISNATGCSSIWANSSPSCAYTTDEDGNGPAWSNSLFEDAAEFGYGMLMAQEIIGKEDTVQWVIGGDGWAYDIGFGGVDHILASGKNINILVLDTECYSNTGGQASKATPLAATAKFATGGKHTRKKDLASIAMTYRNVYVAQVAMGASPEQTVKAFREACDYPGPSIIIAYSTCIAHGIKAGMGSSMHEEKHAVDAGYFNLFRYNPSLLNEGKNPFILDSKEPKLDYDEFLEGENRYRILSHDHPEEAERLFREASEDALARFRYLEKLQKLFEP